MRFPKKRSPLEKAKDAIMVPSAAQRLELDLPLDGDGDCLSPFREEVKPSFSVYGGGRRWHDFATIEGGDVVDFIAKALQIKNDAPALDLSTAAKLLIKWYSEGPSDYEKSCAKRLKRPSRSIGKRFFQPIDFRAPRPLEIEDLMRNRSLINPQGILELMNRKMLKFTDKHLVPCWALLDESGHNAQIRAIDPERLSLKCKALTLKGSAANWPIGLPFVKHCSHVLICEGPPDLIAVATAASIQHNCDLSDIALVAKTGIAKIPEDLTHHFEGKRIRYFAHNDTAGLRAARAIEAQLKPSAAHFDYWVSEVQGEDFNDYASRLWGLGKTVEGTKTA